MRKAFLHTALLSLVTIGFAQTGNQIDGTVKTIDGDPVKGAKIWSQSRKIAVYTNEKGYFNLLESSEPTAIKPDRVSRPPANEKKLNSGAGSKFQQGSLFNCRGRIVDFTQPTPSQGIFLSYLAPQAGRNNQESFREKLYVRAESSASHKKQYRIPSDYLRITCKGFDTLFCTLYYGDTTLSITMRKPSPCIAWYRFNEKSGTEVLDASGHLGPGTIHNSYRTEGIEGNALVFGENNARVNIPPMDKYETGTLTVSLWVKPMKPLGSSLYHLFGTGNYGLKSYRIKIKNRKACFLAYDISGTPTPICSTSSIIENKWTNIAITYDQNVARIYLNGALDNEHTLIHPLRKSVNDMLVGAMNSSSWSQQFPGVIDEIKIFKKVLNPDSIKSEYNAAKKN